MSLIEALTSLIARTAAENPYDGHVRETKQQLSEAKAAGVDRGRIKDIQMELDAAENMFEEWHGRNVFPLEWKLAKLMSAQNE